MKKILSALVATIALLVFSGVSSAESYISIYAGPSVPHDANAKLTAGSGIGTDAEIGFETAIVGGGKAGHWFGDRDDANFGLQFDGNFHLADMREIFYSDSTMSQTTGNVEFYSATVNAMYRSRAGKVRPYVGAGVGWYWARLFDTHFVPNSFSIPGAEDTDGSPGWQVLAGAESPVNDRLSLYLEYKFSMASFDLEKYGIELEYMASDFVLGAALKF